MVDEKDSASVFDDPARSSEPYTDMSALQKAELLKLLYDGKPRRRRKFIRKPYSFPVNYTTKEGTGTRKDVIKDISGDGVFIETREPLGMGEDVTMEFSLPNSSKLFRCEGRVVRSETNGIAVEFKWRSGFF